MKPMPLPTGSNDLNATIGSFSWIQGQLISYFLGSHGNA
jgi:hypothetical protein